MTVARNVYVVAGTNGAGKSTVINRYLSSVGVEVVNPDRIAKLHAEDGTPLEEANVRAWEANVARLEEVRDAGGVFAFETTLGGRTITRLLQQIIEAGGTVRLYYIALESVDLHIQRVATRVAAGGHMIPEDRIRARYTSSFDNLVRLLREVETATLFDNSDQPRRVATIRAGRLVEVADDVPDWAKSILYRGLGPRTTSPSGR